jgi:predicted acylesterase/phospholipase RssA
MAGQRDVAVVLSGGAVNGVLLELGFLRRLRESELWPRVGWIFGTSAGALSGTMAALDRLDDLEEFMLRLQPEDTFRPQRLWRLPLLGSHDYRLPQTIRERMGDLGDLARELAEQPIELVVCATDVSAETEPDGLHAYELVYSSKRTEPAEMAQAILASAAISALVLPLPVGDRIATDGAWVRNYPLGLAYDEDEVAMIVAFRYLPRYPRITAEWMPRLRRRLEPFRRVPPVRALIEELREGEERGERGEPAHWGDMMIRLMRVAVLRNTLLEERVAEEKDESIRELRALREDVLALVDGDAAAAVDERFAAARFPFRADRAVPRITVRGTVGEVSLEAGLRRPQPWDEETKRALIRDGYDLLDTELRAAGIS